MASRRRQEGGKKQNAEGMHGDLTHEAIQQQLKHKLTTEPVAPGEPGGPAPAGIGGERGHQPLGDSGDESRSRGSLKAAAAPGPDGRHRLSEDRQQHDEADKNSEKNRAAREANRSSGENR